MDTSNSSKLVMFQTVGIWILIFVVVGWLFFKPDNSLNKNTIDKLTVAVDGIATASENMTKIANSQRDWYIAAQRETALQNNKRDEDYNGIYSKYDYDKEGTALSLNDLYGRRVHEQAEDNRSGNLRGLQDPASKTGSVQEPTGKPKG